MAAGEFATLLSWVMNATGGNPLTAVLVTVTIMVTMRNSRKLDNIEDTADTAHRVVTGEDDVDGDGLVATVRDLEARVDELADRLAETRRRISSLGGDHK